MKENSRKIHMAKYLADLSKLIIGAGVVVRFFSSEAIH